MTSVNRLQLNQSIQLADWIKDKPAYEDGTPLQQIANEAAEQLGFELTGQNIKTIARAVGFQLPAARKPKVDPVAELEQTVMNLREQIENLEAKVLYLQSRTDGTLHVHAA